MLKNKLYIIIVLLYSFVFANDDCDNCFNPVANAGDDVSYFLGCNNNTEVCLNASLSTDYEGASLIYNWSLYGMEMDVQNYSSSAPKDIIVSESEWPYIIFDNTSSPCFILPGSTDDYDDYIHVDKYIIKLTVSDGQYTSDPDFVIISANHNNTGPVFSIVPDSDYSLKVNESFTLDLSSLYDNTNNGLTSNGYNVLDIDFSDFSDFAIEDHGNYIYTLTSVNTNSSDNILTISDGCDQEDLNIVVTIIGNEPPYSITGPSQIIWSGDTFIIDAGLSFDPDGDLFNYEWVVPDELDNQMSNQSVSDQLLNFTSHEGINSEYVFTLNTYQGTEFGDSSNANNGIDLFFSEYYEPVSSYPKYIELYNSEIESLSLSDYEVWFIDGDSNWNGSNIASSLTPSKKLLFNSCMFTNESGNLSPIGEVNGVDLLSPEDCCFQLAGGYEDGNEYVPADGNLGRCVKINEDNLIIDYFDTISNQGNCLTDFNTTQGEGVWLIPYFDESFQGYENQCKSVSVTDTSDDPFIFDLSVSNSSWEPSCVDNDLSSDDISQFNLDSLDALSALVLSYANHEELENKNYIIWGDVQHGGDDSYAIIKKFGNNNSGGEIVDIIGDCNGNSEASWIQNPLQNSRLIRKEKVFEGNIDWLKSLGNTSDNSDWYLYDDVNLLNDLDSAGEHYCGTCNNEITITSLVNTPPVVILDTPHFIAATGNEFTVLGESSYDPDGFDVYFHWSADDGIGLGCVDGVSSTQEECCLVNSANCVNGNSATEKSCCEESFGVWNLSSDGGVLGSLCESSCCYVDQNPWIESSFSSNPFCFDSISENEESCCVNNGGEWSVIDASLNVFECYDSISDWNGERCEITQFENASSCCEYGRTIDDEYFSGGIWDESLNICLGGSVIYKEGQCFGGNESSYWNQIQNQQTAEATFSIINQSGNCNGDYITERDCCLLYPIDGYCNGSGNSEEDCCDSNVISPYCSNDGPDNPVYNEVSCCELNGGMWDPNSPDMYGNPGGYCTGNPTETWIETYWNNIEDVCVNGLDSWITTSWDYENNICENGTDDWNNNSILPMTLYVSDGYNTESSILQINVIDNNQRPAAIGFIEKMSFNQSDEEYFTLCENYLYQNREDCENNNLFWKGVSFEGYEVYLNGSDSYDLTSTGMIEYRWEAPAGISLSNEFDPNPTFIINNYIAPLAYDNIDFNGNDACSYSSNFPSEYDEGRDCSVGYCSNDNSSCSLNNDCCDCSEEEDVDSCYSACVDICLDYVSEDICCEDNGGIWNILNDGVSLGSECDNACCWNQNVEATWNSCYLDLDFILTVSDGGYITDDLLVPSSSKDTVSVRVKPRMPIVGEIKSLDDISGSSISTDENQYVLLYTSENSNESSFTYDPEGHHDLEYLWNIGSVDGSPDLIMSGYPSDCSVLSQEECADLSYCLWDDLDDCVYLDCEGFVGPTDGWECDNLFYCDYINADINGMNGECVSHNILNTDLPCTMSSCQYSGYECVMGNDGYNDCCSPILNSDGFLECFDNGLSCQLGSLLFNSLPEDCSVYTDSSICNNSISCKWDSESGLCVLNNSENDIADNINELNSCISDESMIYVMGAKGLGDFVDYPITLSVKDVDEIDLDFKTSENESSLVRIAALYPVANAGDDRVYTAGYDQIVLNGYMSHDPQEDKIDYSYWGSSCSDGVSPNESYCDNNSGTWYPGGVWYEKSNLGLLAYYNDFSLESSPGYEFNWKYDLLGNCSDDEGAFCFADNDCNSGATCQENINKSTYFPLYQNLIGENQIPYGDFDSTAVKPFFAAPSLVCNGNNLCEPIRIFFELTVLDNNNLDSSMKVSRRDTVFVDIVQNTNPVSNAGEDLRVHVGSEMVYLDASSSYDDTILDELHFSWTNNDEIILNDINSKRPFFSIPSDLCSDNVSLNEKDCCQNNNGIWLNNQVCNNSNATWVSDKEINFSLTVCDGDCNNGYLSSDDVSVVYSSYSFPKQPVLYSKTNHEKVLLFWDDFSEESIDDLSSYSDFQGYKIYRSEDYGQTWGTPIYRNGDLKGWVPYEQFDMSFESDSLFCLYEFSDKDCDFYRSENISGSVNWYPGYDWQDLGDNSGLVHAFIDSNVVDGIDYTYTITAYDRGYKPDTLQYGSYGKIKTIAGLSVWDETIWKPEVPKYIFTEEVEVDSFYFYRMNFPIKNSSIVNQTTHMFNIEVPPDWNVGDTNEIVSQSQVDEGVQIYNTNNLWPTSNKDGYPVKWSLETPFGTSQEDINYQLATPGYTSSNITSPVGDSLNQFMALDCRSVGNGDVSYEVVDESSLTDELVKLEVQAFEESVGIFEDRISRDPCLYGYNVVSEVSENNRTEHIIDINEDCDNDCGSGCSICTYPLEPSGGAYDFTLSGDDLEEIYFKSDIFESNYWIDESMSLSDFTFEQVLDLPGVLIDTLSLSEANLYVPNYFLACHPITNIDDLNHENNWTDYFKGVTMKFDNAPKEIPETNVAKTKNISISNENPLFARDSLLLDLFSQSLTLNVGFGIEIILSDLFGHVNLLYFDQDAFDKKAAYRYEIELIDPIVSAPDTALFSSTDIISGSYESCGRSFSTLVPFKVKNLTTNKYVEFSHTDNGKWNGDVNSADFNFPTAGIVETHPGYRDCVWSPGEWISFYSDTTSVDGGIVEEKTFKLEFIFNDLTVRLLRPEMCGFGDFSSGYTAENTLESFVLNTRYDSGSCVVHEGLIWYATDTVNHDSFNIPNVYYDINGVNQNPWKPVYPWHDGTKIVLEPQSWFSDEDYWIGDMSSLGKINDIKNKDLSEISVVPNPYIQSSLYNEDVNGSRLRFTHLPSKCEINIFTITGEHVESIYHESLFNNSDGNEWWDLKNSSGRNIAPGLYIYKVETDNGLAKIGKFAIVR